MLMNTLWGIISPLIGLFYAGIQVMVPCLPPAPLSMTVISSDEYMGSWYFVTAAVLDADDLKFFQDTDSSVLHIQKKSQSSLQVTETIRINDTCQKYVMTYNGLTETSSFLLTEDNNNLAVVWDGKYINCPSCAIILHVSERDEINALLFARDPKVTDDVIQEFKTKMECVLMEDFFMPPVKNDYCKLDNAA